MNEPSPRKQAGKLQESRQQLEELLSCQICYSRASNPTLCPHCSKLYCQECLAVSLRVRPDCPNCRRPLKGPLPQCGRFVGELVAVLQSVLEGSEQGERCGQHGITLNYFCDECRRSACCECKMFGSHQNHHFTPISQLYEHKYQQIRNLLSCLRTRIVQQEHMLTRLENSLIAAKTATEAHLVEIEEHNEKFKQKLASHREKHQEGDDLEQLQREHCELGEIKDALLAQLEQAQQINFYRIDQQLLDRLDSLLQKNKQRSEGKRVAVIEEAMPPIQLHTFTIREFSKLRAQNQPYHSDTVEYQGSLWRFIVYPCGNTSPPALSIFLELLSNPDSLNLYLYRIELIHPHSATLTLTKQHHSRFNPNECVGYGKFIKTEELEGKQFLHEDALIVAFGVSLPSYYDLHLRRRMLLGQLEGEIQAQRERIEELQGEEKVSTSSIEFAEGPLV